MFLPNLSACFEFADGAIVMTPLRQRRNKPMPDWARAARFAIRFYRLRMAQKLFDITGGHWGGIHPSSEERYSQLCLVPAFVGALDESRNVSPDIARMNAATADLRDGKPFLADIDGNNLEDARESVLIALYGPIGIVADGNGQPRIVANDVPAYIADAAQYRANVAAFAAR